MHIFFLLMIALLGTRTVYYLVYRFMDFKLNDEPIDNDHLILIYIEEIIFNLIVFYNIKGNHQ